MILLSAQEQLLLMKKIPKLWGCGYFTLKCISQFVAYDTIFGCPKVIQANAYIKAGMATYQTI